MIPTLYMEIQLETKWSNDPSTVDRNRDGTKWSNGPYTVNGNRDVTKCSNDSYTVNGIEIELNPAIIPTLYTEIEMELN